MATEKVYSPVEEAQEVVKGLCKKYPDVLWTINNPEMIAVMGIENKERSEKNRVLAKIKPIKGSEKAIFLLNNIPVRYIIELYWSDFREWNITKKQWIIFHELLHIHYELGKTIRHDCEDFKIILDKVGVNWISSETLPNLLNDDVKFNLELRPSMEDVEKEEGDEIDEPPKKRGRPKKNVATEEDGKDSKKDKESDEEGDDKEGDDSKEDKEDGELF